VASTSEHLARQGGAAHAVGDAADVRQTVHDFKNLLMLITGHSELLLKRLGTSDPLRRTVEAIRLAAQSGTELTRELLDKGRHQHATTVIDVNEVVAAAVDMLGGGGSHDIEVVTRLNGDARVRGNRAQLGQVIVNLVVNAREAMPHGGRIVIGTGTATLEPSVVRREGDPAPGEYVTLTVSDTGTGIAPALQGRIFERYFTTKQASGGTGLGLSVVDDIVRDHGGRVSVASVLGRGATFTVYLPRFVEDGRVTVAPSRPARPNGGEVVMIVEDEADLLDLMRDVLEAQRYVVLQAHDAAEALALSRAHAGPIDLVLTDVLLPKPGVQKLVQALLEQRPGLRIVYVSGHSDEQITRTVGAVAEHQLLRKPFAVTALADKVRAALARS
jgi:CheY-like chemotaxis protein